MTYGEVTEYLFNKTANYENQGASGYKEGLGNALALDEHFAHPHENFRSVHVGGTNGKGSVSHTIASLLQMFGYRVGLYTSPHLVDFNERIRINGKPIPHDYVIEFVEQNKSFFDTLDASFFELTTAMAFKYFSDMDVDIAIVEVGLGGRLDSTNIINPIISVITNVSMDHTQLLGSTISQIAMEKGGIIKKGTPVVIGESTPETHQIFQAIADEAKAPIYFADDESESEIISAEMQDDGMMHYKAKHLSDFCGELCGLYQARNTNTVMSVMHRLMDLGYLCECYSPDNQAKIQKEMNKAFQNVTRLTGLLGRWQTVRTNPTVVCDTGHNVGGWEYLHKQLANIKCKQLRMIFGMVSDKDIYGVMSLLPKNATYYYTKGTTKRAFPETSLKVFGEQFGLQGECYPTVAEAYKAALAESSTDDFIFVGGSTYIVADLLKTSI